MTLKKPKAKPEPATEKHRDLEELLGRWIDGAKVEEKDFLQVAVGVVLLSQVVEREFQKLAQEKLGLGASDLRILLVLRRAKPDFELRPTDLFRRLLVTSGAMTKQVDRLVERGLVRRVHNEAKRRGWLIRLTPVGKTAADRILGISGRELGAAWSAFRSLGRSEQINGLRFIHGMLNALKADLPP